MRRTLRAIPTLLRVGFAEAVAYRAEFLVWLLSTNMPLVMLALWSAVARDGAGGALHPGRLRRLLPGRAGGAADDRRLGGLGAELRDPAGDAGLPAAAPGPPARGLRRRERGGHAGAAGHLAAGGAGRPLAPGRRARHPRPAAARPLPGDGLLGAWLITFLAMAAVGALAFWFESATSLFDVWLGLFGIFSGYLVPLELYPRLGGRRSPGSCPSATCWPSRWSWSTGGLDPVAGAGPARRPVGLRRCSCSAAAAGMWRLGMRRFAAFGG